MHKKVDHQRKYYFPGRITKQLSLISKYPLTVIDAPSGFGKTTAVREYLKENLPKGAGEYWYTCLGETVSSGWKGICNLFCDVDYKVAEDLENLKLPTPDTLFYIKSYLGEIRHNTKTYLVIDNYHLFDCEISYELIHAFSMHGNLNLHIIFITQELNIRHMESMHNDNIHVIGASNFYFGKKDISKLFSLDGINLSKAELEKVYERTGGWISAIKLHIMNYKDCGTLDATANLRHLVEYTIWNKLSQEEKDFLINTSILDSFSMKQAAIMIGKELLTKNIRTLLKHNEFILCPNGKSKYSVHGILRDYLLERLEQDYTGAFRKTLYERAGYAFAAESDYITSAKYFYRIRDFDALLSLPVTCKYFDNNIDAYVPELIESIIEECPKDILCKYPHTLLVFGFQTFARGQYNLYNQICQLISRAIRITLKNCNLEKTRILKGEYKILSSMVGYNDVTKLKQGQLAAWEILRKPSEIIKNSHASIFTIPPLLSIFWRESGKVEKVLKEMDEMIPVYRRLSDGQGMGAQSVIRAEAMLMRGEDDKAEILCYKALYDARSYDQISICLSAELVLTRIAILRGDAEGFLKGMKNIEEYGKRNSYLPVLRIMELCTSIIGVFLGVEDYIAPWLYDLESINKALYANVVPIAQTFYLKILLNKKRYNEFYGACQAAYSNSEILSLDIVYMMPRLYQFIFLAVAKQNQGKSLQALKYLEKALAIAVPDKIYLPFAQEPIIVDLISEQDDNFSSPALKTFCLRYVKGAKAIKEAVLENKSPLAPREREIALLAKKRYTSREIAEKLYISEMTVRTTLRNVYRKLDINSRIELSKINF